MSDILSPGDALVIVRDCVGFAAGREVVLLDAGTPATLVNVERVLVAIETLAGPLTLSVDAGNLGKIVYDAAHSAGSAS